MGLTIKVSSKSNSLNAYRRQGSKEKRLEVIKEHDRSKKVWVSLFSLPIFTNMIVKQFFKG